ncbi:MAG: hypothetical protein ACTHMU_00055 [Thermomicrobiales bacterium]
MTEPRRPVSFRFDPEIMRLLEALKAKMRLSYTSIIAVAVRELAKREGIE